MTKFLYRKIEDLTYLIKRILLFPIEFCFGSTTLDYYISDQREADLDCRRYYDFQEKWLKDHQDKTIDDFNKEFIPKSKNDFNGEMRLNMIYRTGLDVDELLLNSITKQISDEIDTEILKNKVSKLCT